MSASTSELCSLCGLTVGLTHVVTVSMSSYYVNQFCGPVVSGRCSLLEIAYYLWHLETVYILYLIDL